MIQVSAATTTIRPKRMVKAVGNFFMMCPIWRGAPSVGVLPRPPGHARFACRAAKRVSSALRPSLLQKPVDLVFEFGDHRAVVVDLGSLGGVWARLEPG